MRISHARAPNGAIVLLVIAAACGDTDKERGAPPAGGQPGAATVGVEKPPSAPADGTALFAKHCAACHGARGMGDGEAAWLVYPRPRDFSKGTFRLITTNNGFPTDDDLFRTISQGMPGSAMPPWGHLPEADRRALVAEVKKLTVAGRAARFSEEGTTAKEAEEIAREQCAPGQPVALPAEKPASPELLARGKEIFGMHCQSCHDADGRGRQKRDLLDSDGWPIFARDFTRGIFKGGSQAADIAKRLVAGMPGTPMPSFTDKFEKEGDLWATVHYVRAFVPQGIQERVTQKQQHLHVPRVAKVDLDPAAASWQAGPATWLALMPLWWRDERVEGVSVRALHDGTDLAVHLTWDDQTANDHAVGQRAFGDGVAVQLSSSADPALFAMGVKGEPVDIWYWRAAWVKDATAYTDIEHRFPNAAWDVYPALEAPPFGQHTPLANAPARAFDRRFLSGWGAGNLLSDPERKLAVEACVAEGFGSLTTRAKEAQLVRGQSRHQDGKYEVVIARQLAGAGPGSIALKPGQETCIAFAVWDGQALDRNGQKSITIWHCLFLER